MDHVVIPLDSIHAGLVDALADGLGAAAGIGRALGDMPHVTLVAYTGVERAAARAAIAAAISSVPPFVVHAHGYGFFAGHGSGDLNVHVPVVRNEPLAALHRVVLDATRNAGAVIAGWTEPDAWTPHITLLSLALDPTVFARVSRGWRLTTTRAGRSRSTAWSSPAAGRNGRRRPCRSRSSVDRATRRHTSHCCRVGRPRSDVGGVNHSFDATTAGGLPRHPRRPSRLGRAVARRQGTCRSPRAACAPRSPG